MSVTVNEDNTEEIIDAMEQAILRGLEKCGIVCETKAKNNAHVITGRMRGSITHQLEPSEKAVYVGTNVEYAKYEELRPGHEFLVPAARDNADQYRKIIEGELKNA